MPEHLIDEGTETVICTLRHVECLDRYLCKYTKKTLHKRKL